MALSLSVTSKEVDVSISNNTSYVQVDVTATTTGGTFNNYGPSYPSQSAYIQGSVGSLSIPKTYYALGTNSSKKVYSGKIGPFTHNSDGSLSPLNVYVYSWIADSTTATSNTTVTMSTIDRASKPTASSYSVNVGGSITLYTNRKNDSFLHTFSYKPPGTSSYTTIATGIKNDTPWNVPVSALSYFTTASSGVFQVKCDTYNGSTLVGSESINITVNARASDIPSYNLSISEGDSTVSSSGIGLYLQNKSKLKINLSSISLCYSSPLNSCYITINDSSGKSIWNTTKALNNSTATSLSFETSTLTKVGTYTLVVQLSDRRNTAVSQKSTSYTCTAYNPPTISSVAVARSNSSGAESSSGTYLKYTFMGSITSLSNKNTSKFEIGYKQKSTSNYTYKSISTSYSLSNNNVVLTGVTFSSNYVYDIVFRATDSFGSTTVERTLGSDFKLINFNSSGKSMAFGTISNRGTNETYIDSDLTINCMKGLQINGADAGVIVERGSTNNGSYIKYSDGTMEYWHTIKGTIDISTSWGALYVSSDIVLPNFPVAFTSRPTITVTPQTQTGTQFMLVGTGGGGSYGSATSGGSFALVRPNSRTDVAYILDIYAIGKWK